MPNKSKQNVIFFRLYTIILVILLSYKLISSAMSVFTADYGSFSAPYRVDETNSVHRTVFIHRVQSKKNRKFASAVCVTPKGFLASQI